MAIFKRGEKWVTDYYDGGGRRVRETVGSSKREAQALLDQRRAQVRASCGRDPFVDQKTTVAEVLDDELARHKLMGRKQWKKLSCLLRALRERFGHLRLAQLTGDAIDEYKADLLKRGYAHATVNRHLAVFRASINHAMKRGKATYNVVKERVEFLEEHNKPGRPATPEELLLLTEHEKSPEALRRFVKGAVLTGMRRGELSRLKWSDVDREPGWISVDETKSGKPKIVAISSELRNVLDECQRTRTNEFVFTNTQGRPWSDSDHLYLKVCRRLGIHDLRFHDLRHSAASYLRLKQVPLLDIQAQLGHSTAAMTLRYAHPAAESLRKSADVLGETFQEMIRTAKARAMDTKWTQGHESTSQGSV